MNKEDNKREIIFLVRAFCIETIMASSTGLIDEDRITIQIGLYVLFSFLALGSILISYYKKPSLIIIFFSFIMILGYTYINTDDNPLLISALLYIFLINSSRVINLKYFVIASALSLSVLLTYADHSDILPYTSLIIAILAIMIWSKKTDKNKLAEKTIRPTKLRIDCIAENFKLISLGKTARGIVHDLSNPLTSVSLGLDMIEKSSNDKKSRKIAKQAKISADRMLKLINILKSDINENSHSDWFVANQEILRLIQSMKFQANLLRAKIYFCPNCQIKLLGNKSKFGQIISNLLANSLEAIKEEKIRKVYINLWQDNNNCCIAVSDSGSGFQINKNPFEAFFSTKQNQGCHLGLGLTVAKRVVESDFKGEITAENCHCGARFIVKIPIAK